MKIFFRKLHGSRKAELFSSWLAQEQKRNLNSLFIGWAVEACSSVRRILFIPQFIFLDVNSVYSYTNNSKVLYSIYLDNCNCGDTRSIFGTTVNVTVEEESRFFRESAIAL